MDRLVNDQPVAIIDRDSGRLCRPEDIAFTADGRFMAIANSEDDSICLYRRSEDGEGVYDARPVQVIRDSSCLGYVHGVDFSPDGLFLAAVGRETHTLALFARADADAPFDPQPQWVMAGRRYGLCYPAGVTFHPCGRNLVVCNRMGDPGVAFFVRPPGKPGTYGYSALRSLSREAVAQLGLETPHALKYTPDGRHLAICHSFFFKSEKPLGRSGISMFPWSEATNRLDFDEPVMVRLEGGKHMHSLAFHPSGELLGITQCDGHSTLFRCRDTPCGITPLATIDLHRAAGEEGPKGIAFTRDGQHLCISTAQHEVRMYAVTALPHRQAASSG